MEPKKLTSNSSKSILTESNTVNFIELLSPDSEGNTTLKTNMVRTQSESNKNLSNFLSKPQSIMSSIFTPPASPLSATATSTTSSSSGRFQYEVMSELRPTSSIGSFHLRFLGCTRLRHRHTLPMLNWIVADLVNKSKCNGEEIHVKVQECLKDETKFEELRKKLLRRSYQTGLKVDFVIIAKDKSNVYFQVTDAIEENILFHHSLIDIFLFGRFVRDTNLFYYVHKDAKETNTVPSLYVYQTINETQVG